MIPRLVLTLLVLLPAALRAEAPRVVADIAPVHSLVARVMDGVGVPDLVMPPGASPHGYAMRPSEAAALQAADLVVWIGPELTPWLARALETLGDDAEQIALLHADGTVRRDARDSATFAHAHGGHAEEGHEHADDHHGEAAHDDHAHETHDGHDHDSHDHDAHDHETHDGHDHHGSIDPHAWLDPENARLWLDLVADALARRDPENAETYRANAAAARSDLVALTEEIGDTLAPVRGRPFLVYHDAYQYFEARFDLQAAGAIAVSDATAPGAARMAELRDLVQQTQPGCAFYEPQFSPKLVETLAQGTGLRQAELDPIGLALEPGPELYPDLLRKMARDIAACL